MSALTVAAFGALLTFVGSVVLKRRDERRLRRIAIFENNLPLLRRRLLQYLQTNYDNGCLMLYRTQELEEALIAVYRDAAIAGAAELAQCNVFRELAEQFESDRLAEQSDPEPPRFVREGGPVKRNYDYVMQVAAQIDQFGFWLDRKVTRRSLFHRPTRLKCIEIDLVKAGADLSRYDPPDIINGLAIRTLIGQSFMDCRQVAGSVFPGALFDIRVSDPADALLHLQRASWLDPVCVESPDEREGTIRVWSTERTDLSEFHTIDFARPGSDARRALAPW